MAVGNGPTRVSYPDAYERGLGRLEEVFGLEPVVYPSVDETPKHLTAHPEQRAREFVEAWRDPDVQAVMAPLGGSGEQITILRHLDGDALRDRPKRFFGYSDNTSLAVYLWNLGIVSWQGPMILPELAMPGGMSDETVRYCERAFFEEAIGPVEPVDTLTGESPDWQASGDRPKRRSHPGWGWLGDGVAEGRIWGGCLEIVAEHLMAERYLLAPKTLDGCILALETHRPRPEPGVFDSVLLGMAERGLLERFSGIIVGRTGARGSGEPDEGVREVVARRVEEHNPGAPVVLDFNFGHVDPMVPIPVGGRARLDAGRGDVRLT